MHTSRQHGFSLIELMIVMAIIGILASLALPSYMEYVIRARVSEGLGLIGPAKQHVAEVLQSGQVSPAGYGANFVSPPPTVNTASIAIAASSGVVTITTTARAGGGTVVLSPYVQVNNGLPNATAVFAPPGSEVKWQCMVAGATTIVAGVSAGTLRAPFAPPECR